MRRLINESVLRSIIRDVIAEIAVSPALFKVPIYKGPFTHDQGYDITDVAQKDYLGDLKHAMQQAVARAIKSQRISTSLRTDDRLTSALTTIASKLANRFNTQLKRIAAQTPGVGDESRHDIDDDVYASIESFVRPLQDHIMKKLSIDEILEMISVDAYGRDAQRIMRALEAYMMSVVRDAWDRMEHKANEIKKASRKAA